MKRKLSSREIVLLVILLVLVLVSGYYLWFYVPMQERQTDLEGQIQDTRSQIEVDRVRVERMQEMERELEEIFANDPDPVSMAPYDNVQNVMFELNSILSETEDYSLNFSTVDAAGEDGIVRRAISLQFQCGGYDSARAILQELHDSPYRCMFDDLSITVSERTRSDGTFHIGLWWLDAGTESETGREEPVQDTTVSVSATIVFFEYQKE